MQKTIKPSGGYEQAIYTGRLAIIDAINRSGRKIAGIIKIHEYQQSEEL